MSEYNKKPISTDELKAVVLAAMERANANPAHIYAFRKTGRLVTKENSINMTDEEIAEWNAAVDEYEKSHG